MNTLTESDYADIAETVHQVCGDCPSGSAGLASWLDVPYVRGSTVEHDLVGSMHDQAERVPRKSLILAATYRSGSTLLAESLVSAGGYGCPLEYFQSGAAQRRFQRFASNDYVATVMRRRTSSNGVFGVKLFPADLQAQPGLFERLPDPSAVWLRRRDHVAQAVSAWRALNGGLWRQTDASVLAKNPTPYAYGALLRLVGLFAWEDRWWSDFFAARPLVLATLWYEDLASDHEKALAQLLPVLSSHALPPIRRPAPARLRRQADNDSTAMVERFVAEYRARRELGSHLLT